ncbi:MAG: hypothetical protein CMI31_08015 [Opitutae bacterium]|nr:hypothetical protein [Opitutae bacterium]
MVRDKEHFPESRFARPGQGILIFSQRIGRLDPALQDIGRGEKENLLARLMNFFGRLALLPVIEPKANESNVVKNQTARGKANGFTGHGAKSNMHSTGTK